MTAGRELDALVAEKVMGWHLESLEEFTIQFPQFTHLVTHWWCDGRGYKEGRQRRDVDWSPSTDIKAAWDVVEKMCATPMDDGDHWDFVCDYHTGHAFAVFGELSDNRVQEKAETLPLAICLAALKAVGA